ncbi:MAG: chemotaxis protein CheD [Gammaproteobacteria bacterium]|nr:chemotaxis protein CheD [Gammaproteobacteria bacterium]
MHKPPHVIEIYLQPGEYWFGDEDTRIRTILGSCVAITLWHPHKRIGGMCHFMLPARNHQSRAGPAPTMAPDGRYGDEAVRLLCEEIERSGSCATEFEAKLFGGGRMFRPGPQRLHRPGAMTRDSATDSIHDRNIEAGRELMRRHGIRVVAEHLGGLGHRQVVFDIWSGHAWMKHTPLPAETVSQLEEHGDVL